MNEGRSDRLPRSPFGSPSGGYLLGYAWGPQVLDHITIESVDRYRVTIEDRPWVLVIQPQQTLMWVIATLPHAEDAGETIEGDGLWMYPVRIPDVVVGQEIDLLLCDAPYEEPTQWRRATKVTSIRRRDQSTQSVQSMPTDRKTRWVVETSSGATHQFDFTEQFPRHRRIPAGLPTTLPDRYVEAYNLHDIRQLRIGSPIDLDAHSVNDEYAFDCEAPVSTITNLHRSK